VLVGEALGSRDQIIGVVDSILRIFGILGVVLGGGGGGLMAGRALAPLGRITHTAEGIASSDGPVAISKRLDVPDSDDELSHLALTFNVMLDRIETAFDTQRRFVSDASHELRTPLTSVRGNVDVLLRQVKSSRPVEREDLVEVLGVVQRESGRMGRLIDDMLVLARSDSAGQGTLLRRDVVSLDVVAREALHTAGQLADGQRLDLDIVEPVTLYGDGDRLVQVILILLDNALRHTPSDGSVSVRIDRAFDEEEDAACARISVRDTGSGIAPEHVPHLFERFTGPGMPAAGRPGGPGWGFRSPSPSSVAMMAGSMSTPPSARGRRSSSGSRWTARQTMTRASPRNRAAGDGSVSSAAMSQEAIPGNRQPTRRKQSDASLVIPTEGRNPCAKRDRPQADAGGAPDASDCVGPASHGDGPTLQVGGRTRGWSSPPRHGEGQGLGNLRSAQGDGQRENWPLGRSLCYPSCVRKPRPGFSRPRRRP
jgi:signal transduction histidine kinase